MYTISVVVPVYNEKESLREFNDCLKKIVSKLGTYEIIYIDDGSTDGSLELLKDILKTYKNTSLYSFRRNRGKAEALTLGFQKSQGDFVVTLDSDLQDLPEEIPQLLDKLRQGFDLVNGWRKKRKDAWYKRLSSFFFNRIVYSFWGLNLHDYNCGLKIMNKYVAKDLHLYGGLHRFIPLLAYYNGYSVAEIPVTHRARKYGKSKYSFSKIWKELPDMFTLIFLTRFSKRPLHLFGSVGGGLGFIGVIIMTYLTFLHYVYHASVGTRPLWTIGILLILAGLQIFFTGFLADLIIHLYAERDHTEQHWNRFLRYVGKS